MSNTLLSEIRSSLIKSKLMAEYNNFDALHCMISVCLSEVNRLSAEAEDLIVVDSSERKMINSQPKKTNKR